MIRDLPTDEAWNSSGLTAPHFDIVTDNTPPSLKHASESWRMRYSGYVDFLNRLLLEKLHRPIQNVLNRYTAFGLVKDSVQLRTGQSLFCRRPSGWEITPHTHNIGEVVQSLIYFPIPGSPTSLGTRLFQLSRFARFSRAHIQKKDSSLNRLQVKYAGAVGYEANALFAFVNSPIAVHAAEETAGLPPRQYIFTKIAFGWDALVEPQNGHLRARDFMPRRSLISDLMDRFS
jgi:hypothetical protein